MIVWGFCDGNSRSLASNLSGLSCNQVSTTTSLDYTVIKLFIPHVQSTSDHPMAFLMLSSMFWEVSLLKHGFHISKSHRVRNNFQSQ